MKTIRKDDEKMEIKIKLLPGGKCQLKHIEQMLRGIATRDMTPL